MSKPDKAEVCLSAVFDDCVKVCRELDGAKVEDCFEVTVSELRFSLCHEVGLRVGLCTPRDMRRVRRDRGYVQFVSPTRP